MEDQKHTPPYLVNRDRYAEQVQIWVETTPPEETKIATFHGDKREANAQLFMEAPDLKERQIMGTRNNAEFRIENERFRLQIETLEAEIKTLTTPKKQIR